MIAIAQVKKLTMQLEHLSPSPSVYVFLQGARIGQN